MHCPSCKSIWMRPAEPSFHTEGDATWCRRFTCGGCGGVFIMRLTRIQVGMTDSQKKSLQQDVPGTLTIAVVKP